MRKNTELCPGQLRGIHDAGVNKLVKDDDVVLAEQRANGSDGGRVAGGKGQRGFGAFEIGQRFLQFMKGRQRTANQSRRSRAGAEFFNSLDGGFFQDRMVGKAEIIVGREIEESFAADFDARTLGGIHAAQFAEQMPPAQGVQPPLKFQIEISHGAIAQFPSIMLAETVDG